MPIGFIGLGMMGAGMASNLQKAGHKLVVHDLKRQAASHHLAAGADWAESPRAVAEACDVVFTSLPAPPDVEAVGLGENGLVHGFRKGSVWFDLSTNSVSLVREMHAKLAEQGVALLDAPVSGGPRGRELRQAGDLGRRRRGAVPEAQIGARRDGRPGALHRPDRRRLGRQAGAQSVRCRDQHRAGRGVHHGREGRHRAAGAVGGDPPGRRSGARVLFDRMGGQFLTGRYDPPDFALRLLHKDVSLACQLGREVGVPMRLSHLALAELNEALNRGWGERDSRVGMKLQEERAGIEPLAVDPARIREVLDRDG